MGFTYNLLQTSDLDVIRFYIKDTVKKDNIGNGGPRPGLTNYQDEEIQATLERAKGVANDAIVDLYGLLAGEWSSYALKEKEGEKTFDATEAAKTMREQAAYFKQNPIGSSYGGSNMYVAGGYMGD